MLRSTAYAGIVSYCSRSKRRYRSKLKKGVNEKDGMFICMAIQKAKIEVDENGATAAAASALGGKQECCFLRDKVPIVEMKCDRTFCGYIRLRDHVLFRFTFDGK